MKETAQHGHRGKDKERIGTRGAKDMGEEGVKVWETKEVDSLGKAKAEMRSEEWRRETCASHCIVTIITATSFVKDIMMGDAWLVMSKNAQTKEGTCVISGCPMGAHVARIIGGINTSIDKPLMIMRVIIRGKQMMYIYKQIGDARRNARSIIRGQERLLPGRHYNQIVMNHAWMLKIPHQYSAW